MVVVVVVVGAVVMSLQQFFMDISKACLPLFSLPSFSVCLTLCLHFHYFCLSVSAS